MGDNVTIRRASCCSLLPPIFSLTPHRKRGRENMNDTIYNFIKIIMVFALVLSMLGVGMMVFGIGISIFLKGIF